MALLVSCSAPTESTQPISQPATSEQPAQVNPQNKVVDLTPIPTDGPHVSTPNNESLNFRDSQGNVIAALPNGTAVAPTGPVGPDGYLPVKVGDQSGFVFAAYISQ